MGLILRNKRNPIISQFRPTFTVFCQILLTLLQYFKFCAHTHNNGQVDKYVRFKAHILKSLPFWSFQQQDNIRHIFVISTFVLFFGHLWESHVESNDGGSECKWDAPGKQRKTQKPEEENFLTEFLHF